MIRGTGFSKPDVLRAVSKHRREHEAFSLISAVVSFVLYPEIIYAGTKT